MKYFLIAGEASGDLHASNLMKALRKQDSEAEFRFMGGNLMAAVAGNEPLIHYSSLAYMGIMPVLKHLPEFARAGHRLQHAMSEFCPDVVIPVDFGSFNFKYIMPYAHAQGIPIHYYIAPKVWAWKKWRIRTMKRYIDLLLCILPFEVEFFRQYCLQSEFVGNPCVDAVLQHRATHPADTAVISDDRPIIALLSGSRRQEILGNLPAMLEAVAQFPDYRPVIAGAPGLERRDYEPILLGKEVEVVFGKTYSLLEQSSAALVTSGTATLETALLNVPQVVCYRSGGNRIIYWGFKYLFPIRFFSLVNLIAGKAIVPELLAHQVTSERIAEQLRRILPGGSDRNAMLEGYRSLQDLLGADPCSHRAARAILTALKH